jgi:hypothetical protein
MCVMDSWGPLGMGIRYGQLRRRRGRMVNAKYASPKSRTEMDIDGHRPLERENEYHQVDEKRNMERWRSVGVI